MATLWINGVDVESTLSFMMSDEGKVLSAAVSAPQEVEIPQMRGALFTGPYRTPVREFVLEGWLTGASQATVRTNLKKLKALVGDDTTVTVRVADWNDVLITAKCVAFDAVNARPAQTAINVQVVMTFRASNPFWQDSAGTTDYGFDATPTGMPQGTAPSYPLLLSPVGVLTTPVLTGYDYLSAQLWTCTLASLTAGQQYRIDTTPGVMSIEKYVGGNWTVANDALTAGTFPQVLPSNGTAYQSSLWPLLKASTGSWTARYARQWR